MILQKGPEAVRNLSAYETRQSATKRCKKMPGYRCDSQMEIFVVGRIGERNWLVKPQSVAQTLRLAAVTHTQRDDHSRLFCDRFISNVGVKMTIPLFDNRSCRVITAALV